MTASPMRGMTRNLRRHPFVYLALTTHALFNVLCLIWLLSTSLKDSAEIIASSPWAPPEAALTENYAQAWTLGNMGTYLMNSVIVSVTASLAVVLFSTLAGFAFAKLRFAWRRGLLVFVIATMAVPTQLGVIPLYILMTDLDWVGRLQAVIVPAMLCPFGVFWMTQYLSSALPFELIEAARVDGASMFRTFRSIALPAAAPAAAMLFLFWFVMQWTMFFWPSIVLSSQNPTLPLVVQSLQGHYFTDYSLVMAGIFLVTFPLLVIFAIVGKQLVAGIMTGAVKG